MKIYKSVKNENEKLGKENEEVTSSEINNLNLSVIIDLIEKNICSKSELNEKIFYSFLT